MSVELQKMNPEPQPIQSRSFDFAVRVVKLCQTLDSSPGVSRTLANQLLRSGTSIGANISEAQAGQSKKDFISKMSIASKEARETHYWLQLLSATHIIPTNQLADLTDEANQIVAILTTIVRSAQKNVEC